MKIFHGHSPFRNTAPNKECPYVTLQNDLLSYTVLLFNVVAANEAVKVGGAVGD